jgi:biotin carboxyl carrier protein
VAAEIKSEVAGSVFELLVREGDQVQAGDGLLILESMKMEIEVPAPAAGTVASLFVSEGDVVSVGQVLARISA